jgi:signal transduction histidine kinase
MIRDAIRRRRGGGRHALVASLEDLAGRLAHEEQARAAFIGKVSHELRTPLTVIKVTSTRSSGARPIRRRPPSWT